MVNSLELVSFKLIRKKISNYSHTLWSDSL
ncbi:hypothetical protein [Candidatus Protochlamydia amoebophila]